MKLGKFFCILLISAFILSCSDDDEPTIVEPEPEEEECETMDISFKDIVQPILTESCASLDCHGGDNPKEGIGLDNYDGAKVVADNGRLIGAITWANGFSNMPRNADQLDQCTIDIISSWVEAGAMDN